MVETVTGTVEPGALGFTYMHEHVLWCTPGLYDNYPHLWNRATVLAKAVSDLMALKAKGLGSIVDMTPADVHRDPELAREISAQSGVNIIHATGAYWTTSSFFRSREPHVLAELFVHDITRGMNGSGVRAGILKAATGVDGITEENRRLLTAVVKAHLETGVPISTHADMRTRAGLAQVALFRELGANLDRVVIGHCGDTDDIDYLDQLIQQGVFIGLDRFGLERQTPDGPRIDLLEAAIRRGLGAKIVISHDAASFGNAAPDEFFEAQPRWNWFNIIDFIIPELVRRGISQAVVDEITTENPRKVFEGL